MIAKKVFGRGLADLLAQDEFRKISISMIQSGKFQARTTFDEGKLVELSATIAEAGVLQPITVRLSGDDSRMFEIIAGERRWRAAKMAGLDEIPCRVIEASDEAAMEINLLENLQRTDLSPIEEAIGYRNLLGSGYTQEKLAQKVGKSRSHVANLVRLLNLPQEIQTEIHEGRLKTGHGKALLARRDENSMDNENGADNDNGALEENTHGQLLQESRRTVREIENLKHSGYQDLAKQVSQQTNRTISISSKKKGGIVHLHFSSDEDLQDLMDILVRRYV